VLVDGDFDIKGYSGQYLRGDESNQRPEVPGYTVAGISGRVMYDRYSMNLSIDNLFNRHFYSFGVESQNLLGPYGENNPPPNPPVEPFYTPGYAQRITLTLGVRL
jgi:hypothetical protein